MAADAYMGDISAPSSGTKAVSDANSKISLQGGSFDDKTIGLAAMSFTTPIGMNYGLQFDGAVGTRVGELVGGGGGGDSADGG